MNAYLDHSATTPPSQAVRNLADELLSGGWYNPSALYKPAMDVQKRMEEARETCEWTEPGENDTEDEMRAMTEWISGLTDRDGNVIGADIPLHISRFFPRFHMTDRKATDVSKVYHLADVAREKLRYVYTGNC